MVGNAYPDQKTIEEDSLHKINNIIQKTRVPTRPSKPPPPPPLYTNNNFVDMDMVEAVYVK